MDEKARRNAAKRGGGPNCRGESAGGREREGAGLEPLGEIIHREVRAMGGVMPSVAVRTEISPHGTTEPYGGAVGAPTPLVTDSGQPGDTTCSGGRDPGAVPSAIALADGLLAHCDLVFRGGILVVYAPSPAVAAVAEAHRDRIALEWQHASGLPNPPEVHVRLGRRSKHTGHTH